jgi:formylglycine-generating enzyme required for sulfatase activity
MKFLCTSLSGALIGILNFAAIVVAADTPGIVKEAPAGGRSVKIAEGYMVPYTVKLTDEVSFEMIPIPGGKFKLGSPDSEKGRISEPGSGRSDEGPQVEVEIEPFWMGKCEVTWGEYEEWLRYKHLFKDDGRVDYEKYNAQIKNMHVDAITAPSEVYDPDYLKMWGKNPKYPAITMTQFAARQYTKWLSKATGQIYCLPNEAQWEYACRAGTTTAYHCGDDPRELSPYAWTEENSKDKPHLVGEKKPNAWGLHDMHGNVMEWTLDAHSPDGYQRLAGKAKMKPELTNWPTKPYPRVLRGGSFEFKADRARSAARFASDDGKLHDGDPASPRSPWWLAGENDHSVGLRVLRPLREPSIEERRKLWDVDNDKTKEAVEEYLRNGRGGLGVVKPDPEIKFESPTKR